MKYILATIVLVVALSPNSLSAMERINLPVKSNQMRIISEFAHYSDSTKNNGKMVVDVVVGVVEVIGGCVVFTAGGTFLLAGMAIHIFRPEDRREWVTAYSLGAAGTGLGIFLTDNGLKRMGLKGLFTPKSTMKPGVYFSE